METGARAQQHLTALLLELLPWLHSGDKPAEGGI
jgi:hypothetical protein